jgi:hypothetical protein
LIERIQDKMTIKELRDANKDNEDPVYARIAFEKDDPCDPMLDCVWSGWLNDVPKDYQEDEVVQTASSLTMQAEKGINGHILTIKRR